MRERDIRSRIEDFIESFDRTVRKVVLPATLGMGLALTSGCGPSHDLDPPAAVTAGKGDSQYHCAYFNPDRFEPLYAAPFTPLCPSGGQLVPGCAPDLFVINISNKKLSCDSPRPADGDVIQLVFKDENGISAAGQTYNLVNPSQLGRPPTDGEATATVVPQDGTVTHANGGTLTIDPIATEGAISGTYVVAWEGNGLMSAGRFRVDVCQASPEACDGSTSQQADQTPR